MKLSDFALGLVCAGFGAAVILQAAAFPDIPGMAYGPAFFPSLVGAGFVVCGAALVIGALWRGGAFVGLVTLPAWTRDRVAVVRALGVVGGTLAFILAAPVLGFLLTTGLLALGWLRLLAVRWGLSLSLALVVPLVLHYGFSDLLRVPLPRGVLERLLF